MAITPCDGQADHSGPIRGPLVRTAVLVVLAVLGCAGCEKASESERKAAEVEHNAKLFEAMDTEMRQARAQAALAHLAGGRRPGMREDFGEREIEILESYVDRLQGEELNGLMHAFRDWIVRLVETRREVVRAAGKLRSSDLGDTTKIQSPQEFDRWLGMLEDVRERSEELRLAIMEHRAIEKRAEKLKTDEYRRLLESMVKEFRTNTVQNEAIREGEALGFDLVSDLVLLLKQEWGHWDSAKNFAGVVFHRGPVAERHQQILKEIAECERRQKEAVLRGASAVE